MEIMIGAVVIAAVGLVIALNWGRKAAQGKR